jgi:hypothetical protein
VGAPVGWNPRVPTLTFAGSSNTDFFSSSQQRTVVATSDSVAHTMGAWAEVVASTSSDINGLNFAIQVNQVNGTDTSTLMDIGVGASGSEVVIVPFLSVGHQGGGVEIVFKIPVFVPAGSRVAIRIQSVRTSQNITVAFWGAISCTTNQTPVPVSLLKSSTVQYGADTATSNLTLLTAPGSLNTKGAFTEITAATAEPLQGVVIMVSGGPSNTYTASANLVDIGVGAAGSETVVLNNFQLVVGGNETLSAARSNTFAACDIPAGSRISMRYLRTGNQAIYGGFIGIPK